MLPFTTEQFIGVFERYNTDLPSAGVVLAAGSLVATAIAYWSGSRRIVPIILAVLWYWSGVVYHIGYFSEINQAAYIFGAMFLLQSVLFNWYAFRAGIKIATNGLLTFSAGVVLVAFAIFIYPAIGIALGHSFPRAPSFGVPCPLVIFTFGVLVMNPWPTPIYLLIIPLVWTVLGTSAVFLLGMWQDLSLPIAAGIMVWAEVAKRRAREPLRDNTA